MKHIHFDVESDGFYGAYWACKDGSDCAVIAMLGDDPEDYMVRSAVKWLLRLGVNILTMSPGKKDYGHHNYPLEYIEKAIAYLKSHGNAKIGIAGASTTGTLALTAASLFDDISLTIAMTPSDFVWQGFMQGKKDGCKEWPIEGESLFSYKYHIVHIAAGGADAVSSRFSDAAEANHRQGGLCWSAGRLCFHGAGEKDGAAAQAL